MEGALVRWSSAVLNRRWSPRIWRRRSRLVVASREGAVATSRPPDRVLGGVGQEPATSILRRDMGRQELARTVRLPQPMGAGGRRPPVGPQA